MTARTSLALSSARKAAQQFPPVRDEASMRYTPSGLPGNAIVHGACGSWWTGLGRSHCAAPGCHRTFSGESAANLHRVGTPGVDRRCVDPATVGLIARPMPFGTLWSWLAPEAGVGALHGGAVAS